MARPQPPARFPGDALQRDPATWFASFQLKKRDMLKVLQEMNHRNPTRFQQR